MKLVDFQLVILVDKFELLDLILELAEVLLLFARVFEFAGASLPGEL